MRKQSREITYFFFSQYFSDGLRITLAVLIPSLLLAQFDQLETGIMISLGALCVSITDIPGPVEHKRNGMLLCNLTILLVALTTGFARMNAVTLGVEIFLCSFFFSMFIIFGNRAASLGSAALLVIFLMMDRVQDPVEIWLHSLLILTGGLWYTTISLSFFHFLPYRTAQQALGECIHEIARFCLIKASFYDTRTSLEENYRRLIAQQIVVHEKQDAVREVLFKSRQLVQESTSTGRMLVLTFVDVVDLYEQIAAMYYEYASIRERFAHTGILKDISRLIDRLAVELDHFGLAIQANRPYAKRIDLNSELERLWVQIDAIGQTDRESRTLVLKKILISIRSLNQRLNDMLAYFSADPSRRLFRTNDLEYSRFVTSQEIDPKVFRDNLTFTSFAFRHSLRMALASLVGFVVAKLIAYGYHSYWILLTVTVILKPGYSLTKERNYQRIVGTLAGGVIGVAILVLFPNTTVQFVFLVLLMVGSYSFQRVNYIVMVTLMTPFILILFNFMGGEFLGIIEERILDTLIGCGIALAASYLLFPDWEAEQVQVLMREVLKANTDYLQQLAETLAGKKSTETDYKLARKEVYVSSANLSAAFQRMLSEPRSKQKSPKEMHQFVVLNHILSSNIATVAGVLAGGKSRPAYSVETVRPVRRALTALQEAVRKLDPDFPKSAAELPAPEAVGEKAQPSAEDRLLREQLEFIQKVSTDIGKLTETIIGSESRQVRPVP